MITTPLTDDQIREIRQEAENVLLNSRRMGKETAKKIHYLCRDLLEMRKFNRALLPAAKALAGQHEAWMDNPDTGNERAAVQNDWHVEVEIRISKIKAAKAAVAELTKEGEHD